VPHSIYIHIPFCKTHCPYCDFAVWTGQPVEVQQNYLNALCREINERANGGEIETVYLGGGTPSILPLSGLEQIIKTIEQNFKIAQNAEVTLETNPGTVSKNKLQEIKKLGFNRLSVGVQTFDERALAKLARGHNLQDAIDTLRWATEAGFDNISLDLIYGLPGQTIQSWQATIQMALAQQITHISCYSLAIEEGTPYKKLYENLNHPSLPPEEDLVQMYENLQAQSSVAGFEQYEVSNFAKAGFQSRHNLTYWQNQEFYGFGVAAHEFMRGQRKSHDRDLKAYIDDPIKQTLNECDPALEELMLRLRTKAGIDLQNYWQKFGINILEDKKHFIADYQNAGLIHLNGSNLNLTQKGFLLSTQIIANLI
jgi:oxygen-independent coproporphyrinogen III oxidase